MASNRTPVAKARERRIPGAGLSLAVAEWGDAANPTIVLVHGYPDTSAVWDLVAERLAERFHVVIYDVRGAGASDAPVQADGYKLPLLVQDMGAVIDAVSPDAPVHLVGHDWGSIQAWEAVTSSTLDGRISSFTSISGPSLDHVRTWTRQRFRHLTPKSLRELGGQAVRSAYIGFFHTPGVAWAAERFHNRLGRARTWWAKGLARTEGAQVDDRWPAPTFGTDVANGMHLYRANIGPKFVRGDEPHTDVPVQIVIPTGDRFVPASLLAGLEHVSPTTWRREVTARHWVPRSHPGDLATWIIELVDHVEGAPAAPRLAGAAVAAAVGTHRS